MGSPFRLSPQEISTKYNIQADVAAEAQNSFDQGSSLLLAFSGKIGSGKDSVAPETFKKLKGSESQPRLDSFGANLKDELNRLIEIIQNSSNARTAAREIAETCTVTMDESTNLVNMIYKEIYTCLLTSAFDRTVECRSALQYWATEVRRNQDNLYWVKPVLNRTLTAAAQGVSTQITDVRFFTEAWGMIDAGGWIVRLDVSEEEQARRIQKRDGIQVTANAKAHISETELDNFENFAVRILTDDYNSAKETARVAANAVSSVASVLF